MKSTEKIQKLLLRDAALCLRKGCLVAFPTETVYGLGADATNQKAVSRIYEVKGRPKNHPLIIHIASHELIEKWARKIPEYAYKLAHKFWPGTLTLVLPRNVLAKNFITGNQNTVALRVPDNEIAYNLLLEFESLGGLGIAAPSANRFGRVSPTTAEAVRFSIGKYLKKHDAILDGGISRIGLESTILDCTAELPRILRPGAITATNIESITKVDAQKLGQQSNLVRFSGSYSNHYAPDAKVLVNITPGIGDGMIALKEHLTPNGAIRLAAPKNCKEFAHQLYEAFRLGDRLKLKTICVFLPEGRGLELAIQDRVNKASNLLGDSNKFM